jgi:hypothetical protein
MKPLRTAVVATLIAAAVLLSVFSLILSRTTFPGATAAASARD